jgi:hypothetical protein
MDSWIAYAAIAISGLILIIHVLVFAYLFWGRKKKPDTQNSEADQTFPM